MEIPIYEQYIHVGFMALISLISIYIELKEIPRQKIENHPSSCMLRVRTIKLLLDPHNLADLGLWLKVTQLEFDF